MSGPASISHAQMGYVRWRTDEGGVGGVRYRKGPDGVPYAPEASEDALVEDFQTWLLSRDTRPFFYHKGYLPVDRERNHRLDIVALAALNAQEAGRVDLVQRKVKAGTVSTPPVYNYLALKRRKT